MSVEVTLCGEQGGTAFWGACGCCAPSCVQRTLYYTGSAPDLAPHRRAQAQCSQEYDIKLAMDPVHEKVLGTSVYCLIRSCAWFA